MRRFVCLVVTCLAVFACTREARADSGMCREGVLVETGYTMAQVLAKCGEPSWRIVATPQNGRDPRFEDWGYSPGWGSYTRILIFHYGILERIKLPRRK
jgi:hypothetical protein